MSIEIMKAYESRYPDPIRLDAGMIVHVGRGDPEYPGWYWCRAPSGKEGWVHHAFLAARAGLTTSVSDYSAGELTVAGGERGTLLHLLDGWAYIRLDRGAEGWLPQGHFQPVAV